ncbi:MAG: hypothetical protein FJX02_17385 [Alphaproteobacteria bacterium]|nr:hypothetical protein [Alphaproteobacteria bacterium]
MGRSAGLVVLLLAIGLTVLGLGGAGNVLSDLPQSWAVFKFAREQSGLLVATLCIMLSGFMIMLQSFRLAKIFFAVGVFLCVKAGMGF